MEKRRKTERRVYFFVVVGAGMRGIWAASAAARGGASTALVQDRPVLGGCASSEIRMHINGADENQIKPDAAETGIIHEILLENKARNDYYNYSIWDAVLLYKVHSTPNLTLYLNTAMQDVTTDGARITAVSCYQSTTETHWELSAGIFIDCTGNGTLGYMAGAEYRTGSEGKEEFGEPDAPEQPNSNRMGNTLLFKSIDRGHPVRFDTPPWARHFTEDELHRRGHGNQRPTMFFAEDDAQDKQDAKEGPKDKKAFDCYGLDYGYWWIELQGKKEDIVSEYEEIRDELVECVYGVWDHMKNGGDHGAENFDLQWVGMLPGVRESRRLMGRYILTENDILENRVFDDAVAYGGWPIDNHTPGGLYSKDQEPSAVYHFKGLYTIPYRSYLSKDFENLMIAGRALSASKLAMASSRVMGTCAVGGQAAGSAAALSIRKGCTLQELGGHIPELQQLLLRDDCFIPGCVNEDPGDLARRGSASASSEAPGHPASGVLSGVSRPYGGETNSWQSGDLSPAGERLTVRLERPGRVGEVRLTFDSNLNKAIKITLSAKRMAEQRVGVPEELVRDYEVILRRGGKETGRRSVKGNYQRLNVLEFPDGVECDELEVHITATNGAPWARVFEVRAYEQA